MTRDQLLERLMPLARGVYQRALLTEDEAWSGSTLLGGARSYGARYARSRDSLVARVSTHPAVESAQSELVAMYVTDQHIRRAVRALVVVDIDGDEHTISHTGVRA